MVTNSTNWQQNIPRQKPSSDLSFILVEKPFASPTGNAIHAKGLQSRTIYNLGDKQ